MVYLLDTAKGSFNLMLQIGAGTGLLYLVRWFWWRVNAWCEIVAMIASFGLRCSFLILRKNGVAFGTHEQLLIAVIFTTICWVAAAFLGPETDRETLVSFYHKVRPFGPGWAPIRALAEDVIEAEGAVGGSHENMPLALLGWVGLHADLVGPLLRGQFPLWPIRLRTFLLAVFVASGFYPDQGDQAALDVSL